ncbi:uncharacterized protein PHALS_15327 [Plasmopara halstedii]|uniref:Uncharacterized protein n=1 Tax=Plasmopara halstedii TaxID=4781 RepID=A0A0P1ADR0_PLAHL|nr:uncharacterized protein PHALS_15327 [Plasmopara halstedii]CEG38632.1 hypothetical protein PHALS_15327 [Plasmopara halstedii]|eukprot:XP_024575001.1 hypothetical protein PHALS_15327 [Plasmopara halstedii]
MKKARRMLQQLGSHLTGIRGLFSDQQPLERRKKVRIEIKSTSLRVYVLESQSVKFMQSDEQKWWWLDVRPESGNMYVHNKVLTL